MSDESIHLSIVATTRNDNHGGSLAYRTQHFIDGVIAQCSRHGLNAELILVEWNPPREAPSLAQSLNFHTDGKRPCPIRIIRVPPEIHDRLDHSDKIPLFQMIGKNVGIRRARGKFVLATNIDILFSDELICFLKSQLESGMLYRVDRKDIPHELPHTESFGEILTHCSSAYFRINGKEGTRDRRDRRDRKVRFRRAAKIKVYLALRSLKRRIKKCVLMGRARAEFKLWMDSHTNACGDFTLLAYEDWALLRGYPEWNMFSWHIDSVFVFQAKRNGIKEVDLPETMPIYHIEHSKGSGYTPEGMQDLFNRLNARGTPYLHSSDVQEIVRKMCEIPQVLYNGENWGMSDCSLEEISL